MADGQTEVARIRDALERMEGRSPLYDWLRQHRAMLEARFAVSRPRWAAVAKVLAELGVCDAAGRPPAASTVRQAWYRVRTASPGQIHGAAVPRPDLPSKLASSPAPLPPAPAAFDPTEGAFDSPSRFQFKPVKPR
jgi:hypothetical protein